MLATSREELEAANFVCGKDYYLHSKADPNATGFGPEQRAALLLASTAPLRREYDACFALLEAPHKRRLLEEAEHRFENWFTNGELQPVVSDFDASHFQLFVDNGLFEAWEEERHGKPLAYVKHLLKLEPSKEADFDHRARGINHPWLLNLVSNLAAADQGLYPPHAAKGGLYAFSKAEDDKNDVARDYGIGDDVYARVVDIAQAYNKYVLSDEAARYQCVRTRDGQTFVLRSASMGDVGSVAAMHGATCSLVGVSTHAGVRAYKHPKYKSVWMRILIDGVLFFGRKSQVDRAADEFALAAKREGFGVDPRKPAARTVEWRGMELTFGPHPSVRVKDQTHRRAFHGSGPEPPRVTVLGHWIGRHGDRHQHHRPSWRMQAPTWAEVERSVGYLLFAGMVLEPHVMPRFHLAMKWFRRMAAANAAVPFRDEHQLVVWPCALAAFEEWAKLVQANDAVAPNPPTQRRDAFLFTDASLKGIGGVLYIDGVIHSFGISIADLVKWWPELRQLGPNPDSGAINALEMAAVAFFTEHWADHLKGCHVLVVVDNTTAHAALHAGHARSDTVVACANRAYKALDGATGTWAAMWIATALQVADEPSRGAVVSMDKLNAALAAAAPHAQGETDHEDPLGLGARPGRKAPRHWARTTARPMGLTYKSHAHRGCHEGAHLSGNPVSRRRPQRAVRRLAVPTCP